MIDVNFDLNNINAKLDGLAKAAKGAARVAAQAGAEVFYVEMKLRAPVSENGPHLFYGTASKKAPKGSKKAAAYLFPEGTLRDSIYQYYNKRLSTPDKPVYSVSWNHKDAPYGYMVEFGTSRAPANPFLRPSYEAAKGEAQRVMLAALKDSINKGQA